MYMFNDTVTIFTLHAGRIWHPAVIKGCHLIVTKSARKTQAGVDGGDTMQLHIPTREIAAAGFEVIKPKQYDALSDPSGKLAFHDATDFFIEGEFDIGQVYDENYAAGFYDYMNRTHEEVYMITSSAEFRFLPHWELSGR